MAILKVKRNTTNSTVPSGLSAGELAYVQATNKLYIGGTQQVDPYLDETTYIISGTEDPAGLPGNLTRDIANTTHGGNLTVIGTSDPVVTSGGPFGGSCWEVDGNFGMRIQDAPYNPAGETYTYELWANFSSFATRKVMLRSTLASNKYFTYEINTSGYVKFSSREGEIDLTSSSGLSLNTWHHIALTNDGTNTKIYIDGTRVGQSGWSVGQNYSIGGSIDILNTGAHWGINSNNAGFDGKVADIRFTYQTARYSSTSFTNDGLTMPGTWTDSFGLPPALFEIKPEFLTYATDSSADKIVIKDADGSNSYSLTTGVLAGDVSYTLPDDAPNSSKVLASNASGELSYTTVSIDNLATIGDVENTPQDNELLIWDSTANSGSGGWIGKAPSDMLGDLQVDSSSDQTYENLVLSGNLTVKGDSVQLNSSNLAIRDKSLGVGVSGTSEVGTATMDTGVVSITTSNAFSNGDSVFVGDAPNIPTGYYTLADNVKILLQGGSADVSNNTYSLDGAFGQTPTISTGTGPFGGDTYSFNNTSARSFGVNQDDPFGAVSGDLKTGSDDLTIECWIKRANTNSGTDYIWTLASSSAWEFMGFRFNNANTLYTYCKILGGGAAWNSGQKDFSITNNAFDDTSSWHHLVYERYGDTLTVYWDGASVGTADLSGHHWWDDSSAGYNGATIASSRMVLGIKYGYNSDHHFDGEITQLRATINSAVYKGAFSVPTGAFSTGGYTFTVPNSTATESTPFDVSIALPSTDAQVDGSGLIFPGTTEKSLKWNDTNDNFELTGGDLRISGDEFHLNGTKVIDNSTKKISGVNVDASQVTGSFDGGTYS